MLGNLFRKYAFLQALQNGKILRYGWNNFIFATRMKTYIQKTMKKQNKKVDKKQSVEEFLAKLGLVCKEEFYMDDDWVPMKNSDGDFS
jgi:hypothetical protein